MSSKTSAFIYLIGDWTLDTHANQLSRGDKVVALEHRLTSLLVYFIEHAQQTLRKDDLIKAIWLNKVVNDDSLAVAVSQLRKALDDHSRRPIYIKTIPGIGYQFIADARVETLDKVATISISSGLSPRQVGYAAAFFILFLIGGFFWLNHESSEKIQHHRSDQESLKFYEKAQELLSSNKKDDLRASIHFFREAIWRNPNYAEAYVGIAEAKINLLGDQTQDAQYFTEVAALLEKALSLNPSLPRAHMWLAHLMTWNGDNVTAESHFKKSLELDAHNDYGHFLYARFLALQKRFAEAKEQVDMARKINPLYYPDSQLAWIYFLAGDNRRAMNELNRIANTEEGDGYFHAAAQNVYYSMGDEKNAFVHLQWFFEKVKFNEQKKNLLREQFVIGGMAAVYRWLLDNKETADVGQSTPPLSWARYAMLAGEKKLALDYLEESYAKQQPFLACAKADPRFFTLYDDARFKKFLEKFNKPGAL